MEKTLYIQRQALGRSGDGHGLSAPDQGVVCAGGRRNVVSPPPPLRTASAHGKGRAGSRSLVGFRGLVGSEGPRLPNASEKHPIRKLKRREPEEVKVPSSSELFFQILAVSAARRVS